MTTLQLRGHHLLCISRFNEKAKGYNRDFEKNFTKVYKTIINNPDIKIEVIEKCDEICKKCPHIKKKICNKPSKYKIAYWIKVQDSKVFKLIKIKPNSIHEAKDILKKICQKADNKELKRICRGCEYLNNCIKDGLNKQLVKNIA